MNKDWRKLLGSNLKEKEVSNDIRIAEHLGIIYLEEESDRGNKNRVYKIFPRFNEKYQDIIYDIGECLIERSGLESYLQIPDTFRDKQFGDITTNLFFVRIQQILDAYKKSVDNFLSYSMLIGAVAGHELVPNLMIEHKLLLQKEDTPKNQIPPHFEYSLTPRIYNRLQKETHLQIVR